MGAAALLDEPTRLLAGVPLAATAGRAALGAVAKIDALLLLAIAAAGALAAGLVRARRAGRGPTWACGYPAVTPVMQTTAASFAGPLVDVFRAALLPERHAARARGPFPVDLHCEEHSIDLAEKALYAPALKGSAFAFAILRRGQAKRVQSYVLAVFATLLALLFWRLR
jgi:hydrogenase-4 component B